MKQLTFLFLFYISTSSLYASWGKSQYDLARKYESKFHHAYLDTLSGVCSITKYKKSDIVGELKKVKFEDKKYFDEKIEYYQVIQNHKAPLILILPGSFTTLEEDQSIMWLQLFSNLGYHAVLIPNPWSLDFVGAETKFQLGDFPKEAESTYAILRSAIADFEKENLIDNNQIELFGLSHGAFLSSIVNYLFVKDHKELKSTTLISPALNLYDSFKLLDQHIADAIKEGEHKSTLGAYFHFLKICKAESLSDLSEKSIHLSKHIASIHGFQKDLAETLVKYDKEHKLGHVPTDYTHRKNWKQNLRYSDFFKTFAPNLLPLYRSDKAKLSYWVNKAAALGSDKVRLLVSDDDFINAHKKREHLSSMIALKGGGHFGFCASDWFENFLNSSYKN